MKVSAEFIRASAGSGKTYQLSGRYIGILIHGLRSGTPVDPAQILAATFTRAAAGEILERVLLRIAQAVLDPEERVRLQESAHCPDITSNECQEILLHMAENLHRINIGTIDSFFARIARSMPEELGLPADWRVVSDVEAEQISLEVLEELLTGSQAEETARLWRIYQKYRFRLLISRQMQTALDSIRFRHLSGESAEFHGEPRRLDEQEVEILIDKIHRVPGPTKKDGAKSKNYLNALEKLKNSLIPGVRIDHLLTQASDTDLIKRLFCNEQTSPTGTVFFDQALRESLKDFLYELKTTLENLFKDQETALTRLSRKHQLSYKTLAFARGWLTFRDVEEAVRSGIKTDDDLAMSDLYFRLDTRLSHLLLDEFQDTSGSQMEFFAPIIHEFLSKGQEVIVVGDPKQAIYGWRGGDRAVIDSFPSRFSLHADNITNLSTSFRSSPVILRSVDQVFQGLPDYVAKLNGGPEIHQAVATWLNGYQPHQAADSVKKLPGRVRLLETNGTSEDPEKDLILEIIESVRSHYQAHREVAVLTRRKALIPRILAELRSNNLPSAGDGGSTVTDSFAAEVILAALTWMDHPDHSVAQELASHADWAHTLESAWATPKIKQETLQEWRLLWHDHGAAQLIATWVRDMSDQLPPHDLERCQQLQDLASRFDRSGGGRMTDFVNQARNELVRSVRHSPVRVMTIHASKGLEFGAVVLTDLDQTLRFSNPGEPRVLTQMIDQGTVARLIPDSNLLGGSDLREEADCQAFMEQLSVLYVGMTRAKSHLDLIVRGETGKQVEEGKVKKSMASILRTTLGPGFDQKFSPPPNDTLPARKRNVYTDPVFAGSELRPAPQIQRRNRNEMRSPSAEEGTGKRRVNELFGEHREQAMTRGMLIHAWLSQIEWSTIPLPIERTKEIFLQTLSIWAPLGKTLAEEEYDLFLRRLSSSELSSLFNPEAYSKSWPTGKLEVWRERRFVAMLQEEPWTGAFDRVVLLRDKSGQVTHAEVLDFKTDRIPDENTRRNRESFYAPQLKAYVEILKGSFPKAQITSRLVFI